MDPMALRVWSFAAPEAPPPIRTVSRRIQVYLRSAAPTSLQPLKSCLPELEVQMLSWSRVARRIRVPLGFVFAAVYIWLARPTPASIGIGVAISLAGVWL